jgi:hypothetical protein
MRDAGIKKGGRMLVFLDIDGVLRRSDSPRYRLDADCREHFEGAVRRCTDVQLVICSTWRLALSLDEIRGHFSADVAARIIGATPDLCGEEETHLRYREVQAFLKKRGAEQDLWMVIDDDAEQYPPGAPLLLVDPEMGFDAVCAASLLAVLDARPSLDLVERI